eukprot:15562690-Heterocapsa_arctica.AAC.1
MGRREGLGRSRGLSQNGYGHSIYTHSIVVFSALVRGEIPHRLRTPGIMPGVLSGADCPRPPPRDNVAAG